MKAGVFYFQNLKKKDGVQALTNVRLKKKNMFKNLKIEHF